MNSEKKYVIISASAIVILGLTAVTWFKGDYTAVAGYDFATSLNPLDDLKRSLYLWDERLYTGAPNVLGIGTMPYFLLQYVFEKISGSLLNGQMIFFTLILTLPGLTMYFFLRTVFAGEDGRGGISFFGALFYMFNTFVVVKWNRGELITLFSYGMLPLNLALIEAVLKNGLRLKIIPVLLVALFFFPVTLGHSADFLIITGLITAFFVWRVSVDIKERFRNALSLSVVAALSSLWWALPLFSSLGSSKSNISSFTTNELEMVRYYSGWASLLNLMKMWFFSMYTTAVEFNTQFYRPGTLIFPIIGFSALFFRKNGYVLFFSGTALAGLWLAKGTAPPFSKIYEWMYLHLPYFFIFRAPSRYFPLIYTFSLAVLIGYTAGKVTGVLKKASASRTVQLIPGVAVTGLVFFHSWPLFSRDVIFRTVNADTMYPSVFVNIPPYYDELNKWLKERGSGYRVHSFNNSAYLNYDWGYSSTDIAPKVLEVPQTVKFQQELVFGSSGFHGIIDSFDRYFWAWDFGRFDRVLGLAGVKYITVIDDVLRRYLPDTDYPEIMERVLLSNPNIRKTAVIGKAEVYENASALPLFFAEGEGKKIIGDSSALLTLTRTRYFERPLFININSIEDNENLPSGSVDGLLIIDENLTDLIIRNIGNEYKLTGISNNEVSIKESGDYVFYAKGNDISGLKFFIDGMPVLNQGGEEKDGLKWKYIGTVDLPKGRHDIYAEDGKTLKEALLAPAKKWKEAEKRTSESLKTMKDRVGYVEKINKKNELQMYLKEGEYKIRAEVLPMPDRTRIFGFKEIYEGNGLKDWTIKGARLDAGYSGLKLDSEKAPIRIGKKITVSDLDLEKYPYARIIAESYPSDYFDASMILGIDTDKDRVADDEIKLDVIKDGINIAPANISGLLKERFGYPGKPQYDLVWIAIDLKKSSKAGNNSAPSFILKELGFFYEVPRFEKPAVKNIKIETDGEYLKMSKPNDGGLTSFGKANFTSGIHKIKQDNNEGDYLVEVSEKGMEEKSKGPLPELQVTKINPAKYLIEARARKGQSIKPFWLVFNEAFHESWVASSKPEYEKTHAAVVPFQGGPEGKEIKAHYQVNGFANGWWVAANGGERVQILLEFKPQRSLGAGALISAASMAAILMIPVYRRFSVRKHGE